MFNATASTIEQLVEELKKHSSGIICLVANPAQDTVAAACALYLGLSKLGKNISLSCTTKISSDLPATEKITSHLTTKGKNLAITFPYVEGCVDKVDYNIQEDNFNLIITPRDGFPKLDLDQVSYSYIGGSVDFIITVDSPSFKSLGALYNDNQPIFHAATVINIDRHLANSFFGKLNYVVKTAASTSELALGLLKDLGIKLDPDIATCLYAGVAAATNNFTSYSVTPNTFDAASQLLRLGAVKRKPGFVGQNAPFKSASFTKQQIRKPFQTPLQSPSIKTDMDQTQETPYTRTKQISLEQETPPIEIVEKEPKDKDKKTPQDWLKPKIFRSDKLS